MEFELPDIDYDMVKCRNEQLFHWLNHVNATLRFIASDYLQKGDNPTEELKDLDKRVEKVKGLLGEVENKTQQPSSDAKQALTTVKLTNQAVDTLSRKLNQMSENISQISNEIDSIKVRLSTVEEKVREEEE